MDAQLQNCVKDKFMLASKKYNFVFIRNPKCCSRSISKILCDYEVEEIGHYHDWIVPEEYKNYFVFSVVRNPYTRLKSAFFDRIKSWNYHDDNYKKNCKNYSSLFTGIPLSFEDYCLEKNSDYWKLQNKTLSQNNCPIKILFFENIQNEIKDLYFIKKEFRLPHIGKSDDSIKINLTNKIVENINSIYYDDFEKFSYKINEVF